MKQPTHNKVTTMADKKILNTTARQYILKPICKKTGRRKIVLLPGLNIISEASYKLLKSLKYAKDLVEDDVLDFSPKKVKSGTPTNNALESGVKDPAKPLGSKPKKKAKKEEDKEPETGAEDEEYQEYLKDCKKENAEAMDYEEWLDAEEEDD